MFILPVFSALTFTVGETLGLGATIFGIGAGIKGAIDYQKAKKLKAEADAEYHEMASRIKRQALQTKKNLRTLAA
jgi:hypothetical protein